MIPIILLVMNYELFFFALENDFFGVILSMVLFFVGGRTTNLKVHYPLLFLLVLLEFISYRLHTRSLHFLSLCMIICLTYYTITRRFSFIAFISLLLFSSLFNKFFEHLSAEIKQWLCQGVYLTLKNTINIDKAEGVNFFIKGAKITVDTACMGLSMFKTGLLAAAVLLTIEEKKSGFYYKNIQIILFCLLVILLNIVSNFFRIITLVLLDCTQENVLHHMVGLVCFGLYQIMPMLFLIRYIKPKQEQLKELGHSLGFYPVLGAFVLIFITSLEIKNDQNFNLLYQIDPKYDIKKGKWVNPEVFKISTPEKLTYIKAPSHKPLICWTGDGYKISESEIVEVNHSKVWFNKMEKNNLHYKSFWWYECGNKKYTSFIDVMLQRLVYNKPIRLINEVEVD
ncbi:exosortase N [Flavobacterium amniphilum]|uniref:exosortase N n=1 Tax=Flavobacterium amniphilum TaxID=1834035 RepID=UPI00202A2E70|nr:exosortase N [Flavobacterium amniphilum]MCL9804629.1 exosortase N [Flavobacterium amniphilum]